MKGFALYRGAGKTTVERICGDVVPFAEGRGDGFAVCSFEGEGLFIKRECETVNCDAWMSSDGESQRREEYEVTFGKFHKALLSGEYEKLVLSRRYWTSGKVDWQRSFEKACSMYADQTVVLFSTKESGTWMIVTPEVLVKMSGNEGTTMALAGTKVGEREWTEKERREQRVVADYIEERLNEVASKVVRHDVESVNAAALTHLRSRFKFRCDNGWREVARRLHPTPAVCGLPTAAAKRFIRENEGYERGFYSGFCGVVKDDGCELMVTLRCMQLTENGCWLYAGGGLLAESEVESELTETENKMKTIKACIVTK